jgi:hypothetical protein
MEDVNKPEDGDGALPVADEMISEYPCPFLGSSRDPKSVMNYPSGNNRCYALEEALEIARERQKTHCLSENHENCHIYEQALAKQIEQSSSSKKAGSLSRIFRARTLALVIMLLLILIAALFWWPFPGFNIDDGTVFGAQFVQNSQKKVASEQEAVTEQETVSEQETASEQETGMDDPSQSVQTEKTVSQSLMAQAAGVAGDEQTALEPTAVPGPAISDLPDLYQVFQIRPEAGAGDLQESFSPITYSDEGADLPSLSTASAEETLRLYLLLPDQEKGQSITISRLEQVNVLGRDAAGELLRVRTQSGLEGWIYANETAMGHWVNTLAEFEDGSEETLSIPTTLPAIAETEVVVDDLAIHIAPRLRFKIIDQLDKGELVSLLGRWQEGPWVRIRLNDGTEGWVSSSGLDMADN